MAGAGHKGSNAAFPEDSPAGVAEKHLLRKVTGLAYPYYLGLLDDMDDRKVEIGLDAIDFFPKDGLVPRRLSVEEPKWPALPPLGKRSATSLIR